jgi:L-threonylcarbamoyladenylate synthase
MQKIAFEQTNLSLIAKTLNSGKLCVLPTDTLYGISSNAFIAQSVENIYSIKKRDNDKPFIVLIANIDELQKFKIELTSFEKNFLKNNWPNPLSVIFDCPNENLSYLHRNTKSLAFRMPHYPLLLELLKLTGPLTSTTVNISGEPAILSIKQAQTKFEDLIELYVDTGKELEAQPSTVIKLVKNAVQTIRQGSYEVK